MRGKHGGGTRIIRVTDEEWDLVQKHRRAKRAATRGESGIDRHTGTANGPVRGIAMPIQEAARVHESARIPDRVLPHHKPSLSRQSRATNPNQCPTCGGLLGEFHNGKRVCWTCKTEVKG